MNQHLLSLALTAASLGAVHTLLGPDHYVPFVALSRARKWSAGRTALVTVLCGLGHVGSSVLLGLLGIALGLAVGRLQALESVRGDLAAWALIAFGLAYCVWGLRQAWRGRPHTHWHDHGDGGHEHGHDHHGGHVHPHQGSGDAAATPWVLFIIFVFGPCEPLIPLVMYPAARHSAAGVAAVTAFFGAATLLTMLAMVLGMRRGIAFLPQARTERYTHALAGASILLCGLAIQFLGL
jgi:nickel/cobalt transporter (NicO) family protein